MKQAGQGNEGWKQLATLQLILGMLRDPEPQLTLAGKIWLDSLCCAMLCYAMLHAVLCTMLCFIGALCSCGTYTQACVLRYAMLWFGEALCSCMMYSHACVLRCAVLS